MEKLKMHSPDLTERNIDRIAETFPSVVTETLDAAGQPTRAIDLDLLRQEFSDHIVEGPHERYQLNWPGKLAAAFVANAPISKTLRPVCEESVEFDTTANLFIEGDNLDVLKLLQESYLGKVKLIYIDPPYNTGNDFLYADNFAETTKEYLARTRQIDSSGDRLVANTESNGRFHSDWLSMMYPRLKLARNLLSEDGVISISIDDHELDNLRKLMDEVFGANNFIAALPRVTKKAGKSSDLIAFNHDYVILYGRSDTISLNRQFHTDDGFRYEDEHLHERGRYKLNQTLDYGSIAYSRSLDYEIELDGQVLRPGGATFEEMRARQERNPRSDWCWRWSRELFEFGVTHGFIVVKEGREGTRIYTKTYEKATIKKRGSAYEVVAEQRTKSITSLQFTENRFSNDSATKSVKALFDFNAFDYTKPVELVSELIRMVTRPSGQEIVLDFFAGSGTTGQAVMESNAADGGDRRFVLVQLDEAVDPSSEAFRRGYGTIAQLARERLRRTAARLQSDGQLAVPHSDFGFRAFRVDATGFSDVFRTPDAVRQGELGDFVDSLQAGRSATDLLFEVMLRWGLDLALPIAQEQLAGREVLVVDHGALIGCFDRAITIDVIKAIAARGPLRVIVRDDAFSSDAERINAEQILAEAPGATELKSI